MLTKSGTRTLRRLLAVPYGYFRDLTYHGESDVLVLAAAKPKEGVLTQSFHLSIDLGYYRAYYQTATGTVSFARMFRGAGKPHEDIREERPDPRAEDPDILEAVLALCDHIGEYPCQIEIEYPGN